MNISNKEYKRSAIRGGQNPPLDKILQVTKSMEQLNVSP